MPSPDLTEADRAEFEKLGPKLCAALCSLQLPELEQARARKLAIAAGIDPDSKIDRPGLRPMPAWCAFRQAAREEHLPEDEGTYQNVKEILERRANVTQRMIKEFDPCSPAGYFADEAIGKTLAAFDRHVFLSELVQLKLAINQAVADLRDACAKGGRPWKIPKLYPELLEIYLKAGGKTETESAGGPWNAFLRGAHRKLWNEHIDPEAMRAQISTWNRMQDGIKAGLEAEDAE